MGPGDFRVQPAGKSLIWERAMSRYLLPFMSIFVLSMVSHQAPSQEGKKKPEEKPAPSKLMLAKLKQAQLILDGMATNNFDKIIAACEELMTISKAAEFRALKTPEYEVHTNNFRRSLEVMIAKAKDKNLDGVTLGYVDMTFTCVRCHQHTRETKTALAIPMKKETASSFLGLFSNGN